jgi:hypothetical protein
LPQGNPGEHQEGRSYRLETNNQKEHDDAGGGDLDSVDPKELIAAIRGGFPQRCDFCHVSTPPERLHPEEGGDWVCEDCITRWELEDGHRWATGQMLKSRETTFPPK